MKCDGDKATDFHDTEMPEVESNCTCLLVVLTDLFLKKMKAIIPRRFKRM